MLAKVRPFLIIAICSAFFNMSLASRFGEMSDQAFILMIIGNLVIVICNTMAAYKSFKEYDK